MTELYVYIRVSYRIRLFVVLLDLFHLPSSFEIYMCVCCFFFVMELYPCGWIYNNLSIPLFMNACHVYQFCLPWAPLLRVFLHQPACGPTLWFFLGKSQGVELRGSCVFNLPGCWQFLSQGGFRGLHSHHCCLSGSPALSSTMLSACLHRNRSPGRFISLLLLKLVPLCVLWSLTLWNINSYGSPIFNFFLSFLPLFISLPPWLIFKF